MGFSKDQIAKAKKGTHKIRWQPDGKTDEVRVVRVRGETVWVELVLPREGYRGSISLNKTASALLLQGAYKSP